MGNKLKLQTNNQKIGSSVAILKNLPIAEDVTEEVNIQTPLITEILESLVGKVTIANATPETILKGYSAYVGQQLVEGTLDPESLKSGLYVWKKYEKTTSAITATLISADEPITVKYASSFENAIIPYESIIGSEINAYEGTTLKYQIQILEGYKAKLVSTGEIKDITYSENSGYITLASGWGYSTYTVKIENLETTKTVYKYVNLQTSDIETDYPDRGEQDGYWYEKVVERVDLLSASGCTKMAVDKFVFTPNTNISQTINHSLGKIPIVYIIIGNSSNVGYALRYLIGTGLYSGYVANDGNGNPTNSGSRTNMTITTNTIKCNGTSLIYQAGIEYTLITMA